MVLAALLWVLRTLEPSGTPRATSVCRAARVTACFVQVSRKKKKKSKPGRSPNALKCCFFFSIFFCDRSTDRYSKPRGINPCSCALGETGSFEAGICLLCRETKQKPVKVADLSRASVAPQALRCLLVLWIGCQFLFLRGNRQSDCSSQLSISPCTLVLRLSQLHFCFLFHPLFTFVFFIFLLAINVLLVPIFDWKMLRVRTGSLISFD